MTNYSDSRGNEVDRIVSGSLGADKSFSFLRKEASSTAWKERENISLWSVIVVVVVVRTLEPRKVDGPRIFVEIPTTLNRRHFGFRCPGYVKGIYTYSRRPSMRTRGTKDSPWSTRRHPTNGRWRSIMFSNVTPAFTNARSTPSPNWIWPSRWESKVKLPLSKR